MNPTDILFNAVSGLTGGIIHDLQTAMVAVVLILFLMLGGDLLKDVFLRSLHKDEVVLDFDSFKDPWEAARYFKKRAGKVMLGSVEYDLAMARYRKALKRLV